MKDIRIACVICQSVIGDTQSNLIRMSRWIEVAAHQNVSIVCFPEMTVTGYDYHPEIIEYAETIHGDAVNYLLSEAKKYRLCILAGMAEKNDSGKIFATHLVLSPDGIIGKYRKVHIAPPEEAVLTPGDDIPVFEFMDIHFGIQLCYDSHFPELALSMVLKGAEIIFMPHASPRGTPEEKFQSWMRHLPARAFDNSCYVIACNQTATNGKGLYFPGLSLAIHPNGYVFQKHFSQQDSIMIVDLNANDFYSVRNHRMRFFLPKRRPELYSLHEDMLVGFRY